MHVCLILVFNPHVEEKTPAFFWRAVINDAKSQKNSSKSMVCDPSRSNKSNKRSPRTPGRGKYFKNVSLSSVRCRRSDWAARSLNISRRTPTHFWRRRASLEPPLDCAGLLSSRLMTTDPASEPAAVEDKGVAATRVPNEADSGGPV